MRSSYPSSLELRSIQDDIYLLMLKGVEPIDAFYIATRGACANGNDYWLMVSCDYQTGKLSLLPASDTPESSFSHEKSH